MLYRLVLDVDTRIDFIIFRVLACLHVIFICSIVLAWSTPSLRNS